MSFLIQFDGEGVYELKDDNVFYHTIIQGDIMESRYQVGDNKVEDLVIEKYDSKEGWVEGSFTFKLPHIYLLSTDLPEAVDFAHGRFKLRVVAK